MTKIVRIKRDRKNGDQPALRDVAKAAAEMNAGHAFTEEERELLKNEKERRRERERIQAEIDKLTKVGQLTLDLAHERDLEKHHKAVAAKASEALVKALADKDNGFKIEVQDPRDGTEVTGTLVRAKATTVLDTDKLREQIPGSVWDQITKPQVDQELLEQALAKGDITPDQINAATEEGKAPKPSIRITRRGAKQS